MTSCRFFLQVFFDFWKSIASCLKGCSWPHPQVSFYGVLMLEVWPTCFTWPFPKSGAHYMFWQSVVLKSGQVTSPSWVCPVGWGYRIHWLHLGRGVRPHPTNECPGYNTKQCDCEVPVILGLWGMRSTPSLPFLLGPLWLGVVAPDRVQSMGWIELNCILMLNWIIWIRTFWLNWILWNGNVFDN